MSDRTVTAELLKTELYYYTIIDDVSGYISDLIPVVSSPLIVDTCHLFSLYLPICLLVVCHLMLCQLDISGDGNSK